MMGLEVDINDGTYVLSDNFEILKKGTRIDLREDGEESLVWLRLNPLTETDVFLRECSKVPDDDVFLIAGNTALNKINRRK